jgi:hypothetical protein
LIHLNKHLWYFISCFEQLFEKVLNKTFCLQVGAISDSMCLMLDLSQTLILPIGFWLLAWHKVSSGTSKLPGGGLFVEFDSDGG